MLLFQRTKVLFSERTLVNWFTIAAILVPEDQMPLQGTYTHLHRYTHTQLKWKLKMNSFIYLCDVYIYIYMTRTLAHTCIFPLTHNHTYTLNQNFLLPNIVHCGPTFRGIGAFLIDARVKKLKSVSHWYREDMKTHWVSTKLFHISCHHVYSTSAKPLPQQRLWECLCPTLDLVPAPVSVKRLLFRTISDVQATQNMADPFDQWRVNWILVTTE